MTIRNIYRKSLNNVMLTLTGICAFVTVSTLFVILAYLVYNGGKSVDLAFFTQLPKGAGEEGGGMANAILGSAEIVAIASAIGIPIGFFTGVYLSEWGGPGFSFLVRYMCDLLNGVPSIVIGIFAWIVVVKPMHQFSALAGGFALNNQYWSTGLSEPTASLPVMIYTHAISAYDDWHRQAWAAGLVLLCLVLVANIAARLIVSRGTTARG